MYVEATFMCYAVRFIWPGPGPGPWPGPGPGPLPIPTEKGRMTMASFLLSPVKGCEGGYGLCHHILEKKGLPF